MKLNEIFDQDYYDHIQQRLDTRKPAPSQTSETSVQDFIISAYEAGDITYDDAMYQLKQKTPKDQMFFWEHELAMARELQDSNH